MSHLVFKAQSTYNKVYILAWIIKYYIKCICVLQIIMPAHLVHVNIMVSVLTFPKGFNADAKKAMKDRPAPVCIVQFQLVYSAFSIETRVYTRSVFVVVSVSCTFDINKRAGTYACGFACTWTSSFRQ